MPVKTIIQYCTVPILTQYDEALRDDQIVGFNLRDTLLKELGDIENYTVNVLEILIDKMFLPSYSLPRDNRIRLGTSVSMHSGTGNRTLYTMSGNVDGTATFEGRYLRINTNNPSALLNSNKIYFAEIFRSTSNTTVYDQLVQINVDYSFNPPTSPTSLSPNKSVLNPRTPIRFSWDNKYTQTKFQIRWKHEGGTYKYIERTSVLKYHEMPAGTIEGTSGAILWSVRTAGESGVYSEWEDAMFELGTETQAPPIIVSPNGSYIKGDEDILFKWQFPANASEKQKSFELEYTLDKSVGTTTIVKIESSDEFYLLEHNHNSSTIGKWRVRVVNNYDEESDWSEYVEFNMVGAPPIPQILEVTNANIPTIKWNSKEQAVFEIIVYDKDDNEVYTTGRIPKANAREYTLDTILKNDKYKFALIVHNVYDVSSPQAEYTIKISPEPIATPTITVHEDDYFIMIKSDVLEAQVYRDGKHIANLVDGEFRDYTGANNRIYNYSVRNIINGVYADSKSISAKVNFLYDTLALYSSPGDYIKLDMHLDTLPEQQNEKQYDMSITPLDGRKYPIVIVGEKLIEQKTIKYFVYDRTKIYALLDATEELIYRNSNGEVFIGVAPSISDVSMMWGFEPQFTMTRTRDSL